MSWDSKTDYCGLATTGLSAKSSNDNGSAQYLEKTGKDGTIKATKLYGQVKAPSNEYIIEKSVSLKFNLGKPTSVEGKRYALANVTATVGAATEPTLSADSVQIEDTTDGKDEMFEDVTFALSPEEVVQAVMDAYTLTGSGCEETQATYQATCTVSPHTKNGDPKASSIHTGKVTIQVTIGQYGTTKPTLAAKTGWEISSPLSCSDQDADYPTWTATLTKPLAKKVVSAG